MIVNFSKFFTIAQHYTNDYASNGSSSRVEMVRGMYTRPSPLLINRKIFHFFLALEDLAYTRSPYIIAITVSTVIKHHCELDLYS